MVRRREVLGVHSETGSVLWAVPVAGLSPSPAAGSVVLGLQRGTAHFPHPPVAVLLSGRLLVTFNPITGGDLQAHQLPYEPTQASLLPHADNTHLKPLLILDSAGAVHVWPESAESLAKSLHNKLFFYTVDVKSSTAQGYAVNQALETVPSWRLDLGSQGQTIRRVLAKSPHERVHSQGRVLADRSVLYKYSNPNLVLVLADAPDPVHKHSTSAYLVDAVTGHLIYSHVQRRVRCPCHAVHSENWLVYSVYNEKARRTELTSIELFEGKVQANASAFSSLEAPPQPMVEKQTFIFPTQIEAMRETITEKGITTKFIMFALTSGSLVTLNRALLDPRRPLTPGRASMEEGLPPYTPELPLPTVNVVNYNRTLQHVSGIVSSPSGLESTCLVFVHGLDLYHTRVFPSNMFDQLKDDFDSTFIVLVLVGLITASAVTRRLSQRRALQLAWK
ncbi:ER membrane protein complex subunit 1 [Amphibalanus amphitrite]|uniref:ER membrane protein complex subunit 1 n=1 Tax=Amphibalanus amphitrite TaxID=1232801 RepID=A0A6A4VUJ0_AMPAM|nr:ER membrane protein complex subunit 1 [Amphibalanus amphitrite]